MRAIRAVSTVLCIFLVTVLLMMGCHGGRTDSTPTELDTHPAVAAEPASSIPDAEPVPGASDGGREDSSPPTIQNSDGVDDPGDPPPAAVHRHRYTAVQSPPSCVAEGYTTYACSCGDSYISDYQSALGHTYGSWVTEIHPTVTAEGHQKRTCTRCGHRETAVLPKLANTSEFAQEVVALVNKERRNMGLSPLVEISALDNLAQTRSQEIVARFEHVRPDGSSPLDGRNDLCVLWDIRVHDGYKRQGIGKKLFKLGVQWAVETGLSQMKIECQNNNVPACKFYQRQGAVLSAINEYAYYQDPTARSEIQLIWYLDLVNQQK